MNVQLTYRPARLLPRFPITRQGYDCDAVDEHVGQLERELAELDQELAELRAQTPSDSEVVAEIRRIGEQTADILIAAHEAARQTTRQAQEQSDRCIADAASQALAITDEARRQLRSLEEEQTALRDQHGRLLAEIRGLSDKLAGLAQASADRVPPATAAAAEAADPATAADSRTAEHETPEPAEEHVG